MKVPGCVTKERPGHGAIDQPHATNIRPNRLIDGEQSGWIRRPNSDIAGETINSHVLHRKR